MLNDLASRLLPRRRFDATKLPNLGQAPDFSGLNGWLNGEPLTWSALRGKAVLVDFWTYSCINCLRTLPYLKAWHETYAGDRFVIVGVHTPEFQFEREEANLRAAVTRLGIPYVIARDDDYSLWNAYRNRSWPAHYFVDAQGRVRHRHFGEGSYAASEAVIRALIAEAGEPPTGPTVSENVRSEVDFNRIGTPELYLGFARQEYLGSPEPVRSGVVQRFTAVGDPAQNVFYLEGDWEIQDEYVTPRQPGAKLFVRYRAPRLHLVAEGATDGLRMSVRIDGRALAENECGRDTTRQGDLSFVQLRAGRLYEIIDDRNFVGPRLLELTMIDPGAKLYSVTFG